MKRLTIAALLLATLGTLGACAPQRPLTQAEARARHQYSVDLSDCRREVAATYAPTAQPT